MALKAMELSYLSDGIPVCPVETTTTQEFLSSLHADVCVLKIPCDHRDEDLTSIDVIPVDVNGPDGDAIDRETNGEETL